MRPLGALARSRRLGARVERVGVEQDDRAEAHNGPQGEAQIGRCYASTQRVSRANIRICHQTHRSHRCIECYIVHSTKHHAAAGCSRESVQHLRRDLNLGLRVAVAGTGRTRSKHVGRNKDGREAETAAPPQPAAQPQEA